MDTKLEEKKPAVKAKGKEGKENTTSGNLEAGETVTNETIPELTQENVESMAAAMGLSSNESNDKNEGAHISNTSEMTQAKHEPKTPIVLKAMEEANVRVEDLNEHVFVKSGGIAGGLIPLMTPEELDEHMNGKKAIAAFSESEEELKNVTAEKLFAADEVDHNDKFGENSSIHNVKEFLPPAKQKERPTRSLTYGEKLAGVFENPSDNEDLNRIKELAAEMIDIVAKTSSHKPSETHSPEQLVFVGAINDVISAQQKCCRYIAM